MLETYRAWLVSELTLLKNASHHAYAFGQANMAQRAIEQLDAALAGSPDVCLKRALAERALALLDAQPNLTDGLAELAATLREALAL